MNEVQEIIDTIFSRQSKRGSEFTEERYAILFKPGKYSLDVKVDYYMQVLGLGKSPEDVVIEGAVRSNTLHHKSVLTNFWRAVENLTIVPTENNTMVWGVSQASPLRRVYVKGNLNLFDKGYASGGFLANSKVDGTISSGPQQQWFTRNSEFESWSGGVWNMMFVGSSSTPEEDWPEKPYTVIEKTPVLKEKPWLCLSGKNFTFEVPEIKYNSTGPDWTNGVPATVSIPLKKFHIAFPGKDNSVTLNEALSKGKHLLFTPGRYHLDESIKITNPGTIVAGLGLASLIPVKGNAAIETDDKGGIIISGLTIDAGEITSPSLVTIGKPGSAGLLKEDPIFIYDLFFRVGGPSEGSAVTCLTVNSNDVCIDHVWLWRADHGNGVGWERNRGANGLIVNGNDVTVYGLFNEHFQEYQTIWNGENGRVYFYQSEMPYDPPSAEAWTHNGINGYASYKVSDHVKTHEAWGIGIYNVFYDAPVIVDNAIEVPEHLEDKIHHKIIFWLNGNKESVVKSIINGKGGPINIDNRKATLD